MLVSVILSLQTWPQLELDCTRGGRSLSVHVVDEGIEFGDEPEDARRRCSSLKAKGSGHKLSCGAIAPGGRAEKVRGIPSPLRLEETGEQSVTLDGLSLADRVASNKSFSFPFSSRISIS